MRIVRIKVFHQGTFEALVEAAQGAGRCLQHRGQHYERIAGGARLAIYRRSPHGLNWIRDRVEDYEFGLFLRLLSGSCGRDGFIRRHASVARGPNGAYRLVQPESTSHI